MLVAIRALLNADELALCRTRLTEAPWVDGRITAGYQSAEVKRNLQLPEGCGLARELSALVLRALERDMTFLSAALPRHVYPPLFNRYESGMDFGAHVDNAIRQITNTGQRIRTDISATLFLSAPEDYDGGELIVEDTFGTKSVKLPAGDMVLYPASSLHRVTPVTRGCRDAAFFWVQSMVKDHSERRLLYDLDRTILGLTERLPRDPALPRLVAHYHNLVRKWAEA